MVQNLSGIVGQGANCFSLPDLTEVEFAPTAKYFSGRVAQRGPSGRVRRLKQSLPARYFHFTARRRKDRPMADVLLDPHQVALWLNVPLSFVYSRTRVNARERIPHLKIGKYLRFHPERLTEWIVAHERGDLRNTDFDKPRKKFRQAQTTSRQPTKRQKSRGRNEGV